MKIYNNKKGFTLAELLMVVSIIGMLVALSIPIFSGQLEKSRDAVTVANLRNAYAEAQTAYLTETSSSDGRVIYGSYDPSKNNDLEAIVTVKNVVAKGKKVNKFSGLFDNLPFAKLQNSNGQIQLHNMDALDEGGKSAKKYEIQFIYNVKGELIVVQSMN